MQNRLVILGGGESGVGAALLGKMMGYEIFVSDGSKIKDAYKDELAENGIAYEELAHTEALILNATEVMKSPGIPEKADIVKKIRSSHIPVISEVELAFRHKGNSRIVAITGSNGKTTTTSLIFHILKTAGLDCALVGNIGYSIARQVAEDPREWYVAEISSFQLDDIHQFRPDVAVLTNITEDHLDRYDYDFKNYIKSKFRITINQTAEDYFIYCADDPVTNNYMREHSINTNLLPFTMQSELNPGAYIMNDQMTIQTKDEKVQMSVNDFTLRGKHNQYNTMAAGLAASVLRIRNNKVREAIQSFEALEHRMEFVVTIRGVDFINDSKATNVNSTWYALESMQKPTILIMGGVDKGNDYEMLKELVKEKVKAIICLGIDNSKIHESFEDCVTSITDTVTAGDAVRAAYSHAAPGDVILLSPACASFDLFNNYEDRGEQFKEAVRGL